MRTESMLMRCLSFLIGTIVFLSGLIAARAEVESGDRKISFVDNNGKE